MWKASPLVLCALPVGLAGTPVLLVVISATAATYPTRLDCMNALHARPASTFWAASKQSAFHALLASISHLWDRLPAFRVRPGRTKT